MVEDVVTFLTLGSRGDMFMSYLPVNISAKKGKEQTGGMTGSYIENGEYATQFYAILSMPSCIKANIKGNGEVKQLLRWGNFAPEILREEIRKEAY